jgi:ectoine hydroxylase-related dioxygenase (phytanoyl-CoA dioxygenase family)
MTDMDTQANTNFRIAAKAANRSTSILSTLETLGFAVLENAFDAEFCHDTSQRLLQIQSKLHHDLRSRGLLGEAGLPSIPLLMHHDPHFYRFLEMPELLPIVEGWVGPDAILRNQYGLVYPPVTGDDGATAATAKFHRQFRHLENMPRACLDMAIFLVDIGCENGAIHVVPGSHNYRSTPTAAELDARAQPVTGPAGSILIFDGMTWHREDPNRSNADLPLLMHEFVKPVIKQYWDFPRILAPAADLSPRLKQLLGFHASVPASVEEFCQRSRQPGRASS